MSPAQLNRYPNAPAGRGTETSRQAARDIRPRARPLREAILACLAAGPLTSEQLAQRLAPTPACTVKPRLSELCAAGKIEPCPERVVAASGWRVRRWRLATGPRPQDPAGPPVAPGLDPEERKDRKRQQKLRQREAEFIVRALAVEPMTSEALTRGIRRTPNDMAGVVSALRRAGVVQPSGLHGLSRYGKKMARWQLCPGPYWSGTPAPLLAVLREVTAAKLTPAAEPFQFAFII